jgi:hypothetical protein
VVIRADGCEFVIGHVDRRAACQVVNLEWVCGLAAVAADDGGALAAVALDDALALLSPCVCAASAPALALLVACAAWASAEWDEGGAAGFKAWADNH